MSQRGLGASKKLSLIPHVPKGLLPLKRRGFSNCDFMAEASSLVNSSQSECGEISLGSQKANMLPSEVGSLGLTVNIG